jgi:Helix-turn-helix domain
MKTADTSQISRTLLCIKAAVGNLRLATDALNEAVSILNEESAPTVPAPSKPQHVVTTRDHLTRREAAEFLGLKPSTLSCDVVTRRLGIPYYKLGRRVIYSRVQLEKWRNEREMGRGL